MRARRPGETSFLELTHDRICEVLSVKKDWYRLVDDSDEGYLCPSEEFEIVRPKDDILNGTTMLTRSTPSTMNSHLPAGRLLHIASWVRTSLQKPGSI